MNSYGLFRSVEVAYAIPLPRLVRVLFGERCYPLPKLSKSVAGVVVWDGLLIPQVELARLLRLNQNVIAQATYQVLVTSEAGMLALTAEQTCGIVAESNGELFAAAEQAPPSFTAEFHCQGRVFHVLDIDCLAIDLTQEPW